MAWLARNIITIVAAVVAIGCSGGLLLVSAQKGQVETGRVKAVQSEKSAVEAELASLRKKYSDLETDRNNVLTQTKLLLQDKAKYAELQDTFSELEKTSKNFAAQKDKLHKLNVRLSDELESLKSRFQTLEQEAGRLKEQNQALSKDNEILKTAMAERVESSPVYKTLLMNFKASESEAEKLKLLNQDLEETLQASREKTGKVEGREEKYNKQLDDLKKKADLLKVENDKLKKLNKELNNEVKQAPKKFKDMANQHKSMVREIAEMHYNLGVFYVENKTYDLARREFERALQFNPNNPKTHYNLGYLYSEFFQQHEKAMGHFQRYLEIDPHSKESTEIRSYLLERQAYGDKIPPTELPNTNIRLKK